MSLALFNFNGASVRVIDRDGGIWFLTADACRVLGIQNSRDAVAGLDSDDVATADIIDNKGRKQTAAIVNESGLYNLIFKSRKSEAKAFKRWVTSEVLPTIRKTGAYGQQNNTTTWLVGKLLEIAPAEDLLRLLKVRHSYGSLAKNGRARTGWRGPAYVASNHRQKDARIFHEGVIRLEVTVQLELPKLAELLEGRAA